MILSINPSIYSPLKIKQLVLDFEAKVTGNSVNLYRLLDDIEAFGFKSDISPISKYNTELSSIILLGILFNNNLNIIAKKNDLSGYSQLRNSRIKALKDQKLLGKLAYYLEYSQNPLLNEVNMGKLFYFAIKSLKQANRIIDFPQAYISAINDNLRNNLDNFKPLTDWYDKTPKIIREHQLKIIFSNLKTIFPSIRMKDPVSITKSVWGKELVLIRILEKNLNLLEEELVSYSRL